MKKGKNTMKKMKALIIIITLAAIFAVTAGCSGDTEDSMQPIISYVGLDSDEYVTGQPITVQVETDMSAQIVMGTYNNVPFETHLTQVQEEIIFWTASLTASDSPGNAGITLIASNSQGVTSLPYTTIVNVVEEEQAPVIYHVEPDHVEYATGQLITLHIETNGSAETVMASYGGELIEASVTQAEDDFQIWTVFFPASDIPGEADISVVATNAAGEASSPFTIYIMVMEPEEVIIHSVKPSKTTILTGESLELTILTNEAAAFVWKDDGNEYIQATLQDFDESGIKTWTLTCRPNKSKDIVVYANRVQDTEGAATMSQAITVAAAVSNTNTNTNTNTDTTPKVKLLSQMADKSTINAGEPVTLTVKTNSSAVYVWVTYDETSTELKHQSTAPNGDKTWIVTIFPDHTQSLRIYAHKSKTESGATFNSIKITVNNGIAAKILSASVDRNTVNAGETVVFTVQTNGAAHDAWLNAGQGNIALKSAGKDASGNKTWRSDAIVVNKTTTYQLMAGRNMNTADDTRALTVTLRSEPGPAPTPAPGPAPTPAPGPISVSAWANPNPVIPGQQTTTITISTSGSVTSVEASQGANGAPNFASLVSSSGDIQTWVVDMNVEGDPGDTASIIITAGNGRDSKTTSVSVDIRYYTGLLDDDING